MWAGGALEILSPIKVGARGSPFEVASVNMKDGRSGPLCFVAVEHELVTPTGVAIRERQDIVIAMPRRINLTRRPVLFKRHFV